MKFDSLAKRAFLFTSLCCLTAPAIAGCSNDELLEYARVDEVLAEYKDSYIEANLAIEKYKETNALEDVTKYCQLQRQNLQLSQEWLSIDAEIEKACPIFYSKGGGDDGKVMFNTNQPLHQNMVDTCEANGL
jgi:hypothetical protein